MGTHWKLKGNIVGTHWEPEKNGKKKNPSPPPPSPPKLIKEKKQGIFSFLFYLS
jgi:hypothetical protein